MKHVNFTCCEKEEQDNDDIKIYFVPNNHLIETICSDFQIVFGIPRNKITAPQTPTDPYTREEYHYYCSRFEDWFLKFITNWLKELKIDYKYKNYYTFEISDEDCAFIILQCNEIWKK